MKLNLFLSISVQTPLVHVVVIHTSVSFKALNKIERENRVTTLPEIFFQTYPKVQS